MSISQVRALLNEGNLAEALQAWESFFTDDLSEREKAELVCLKSEILAKQERFDDIIEIKAKLSQFPELQIELICSKINAYFNLSDFESCKTQISLAHQQLSREDLDEKAYQKFDFIINEWEGKMLTQLAEYKMAIQCHQHCFQLAQSLKDDKLISTALNNMGTTHYYIGNLDIALDYYLKSSEIRERLGDKYDIGISYNNLGVIYSDLGNITTSLEYYQKSLLIYEELNLKGDIADSLNNLGVLYADKGEINLALEYYEKSMQIKEEIGNIQGVATSLSNIGVIYQMKGEYEKAIEYVERGFQLDQEIGVKIYIAEDYFILASIYLNMNQINAAKYYLEKLEIVDAQEKSPRIHSQYLLLKAMVLKRSKRRKNKSKAQEILEEIIEEREVDHEIKEDAMLNLAELLIDELSIYGEEEILVEVKSLVDKLLERAKSKNSFSMLAECYLLQSKLELIELNILHAQRLLVQAQFLCEEKGLNRLAMKISDDHDVLLNEIATWNEFKEKKTSIKERLKQAKINDLMERMLVKQAEEVAIEAETPILLLVLSQGGTSLYAKTFGEIQGQDQLIAGFLYAINTFMENLFKEAGSIDRIKYKDYTVLVKPVKNISFCYAFKGQSYAAQQKIDSFISHVQENNKLWNKISKGMPILSHEQLQSFDSCIHKVFS
ncbi:MAG: tetratricopeptide repeat protein [Candidatus Heimdallarchaeota archaeon]|nr:tetratricopeptide repeat protein [Candidatus Heimdallarchaeota archaeon]